MTTQLAPLPVQRFFDNNNNPLVGGLLYTYTAGTTTPLPTYTDSTGNTANTNPVVMNSRGEANVWLTPGQAYKFVLKDSLNNTIWTVDNIINGTGLYTANVKDFGAKGDGSTNDTTSIQNAINYAVSNQLPLYFPAGTYIHSGLTIGGGLTVTGAGRYLTLLRYNVLSGTAISIDCQAGVRFSGITFAHTTTPTAGKCISLTASTSGQVNQNSIFRDCSFDGLVDCIYTIKAMTWVVDNCVFQSYTGTAIHVENDDVGDNGDSIVHGGCIFAGVGAGSVGILQVSSGGLKVVGNKLVTGAYGYLMQLAHGVQTGCLVIVGNSFENMSVAGIQLNRVAGGASDMRFSDVVITGNEFLATATGIPINLNDSDAAWLQGITITGNMLDCSNAGFPNSGILVNSASTFNITGNTIIGTSATAGINIGALATKGVVGNNALDRTTLINSSPSTAVAKKVTQGITGTIVCSTGVGSVFQGTASVTFPTGLFTNAPVVTATIGAGSNGIGANATGTSNTGTTIQATAATTGANVAVYWRAEADY